MNFLELIELKKNGEPLSAEALEFSINAYIAGEIPDYQMAAFLMAVWFRGFNRDELYAWTKAMVNSGHANNFAALPHPVVDKHSTGGVGDKVSLALGPIVAACHVYFAKMSGRGLDFTGGTIDKLESIPGLNTALSADDFVSQVKKIGLAIASQTADFNPADKALYALRDVTGTVDSWALIASSIMSKKIVLGADVILLDVKFGDAAFATNINDAYDLAQLMIELGKQFNKKTLVEITSMAEPLGWAVGNRIEVIEALEFLEGKNVSKDFAEIVFSSATTLLVAAKVAQNEEEARAQVKDVLANGSAKQKFLDFIAAQGGDISILQSDSFWKPRYAQEIKATKDGYINFTSARAVGEASVLLGAGRVTKSSVLDFDAGIRLKFKSGDVVKTNDVIMVLYASAKPISDEAIAKATSAFRIDDKKPQPKPLILERLE